MPEPIRPGFLDSLTRRALPEYDRQSNDWRVATAANLFTILITLPIGAVGLIWLIQRTDWSLFVTQPLGFLLFFGLILLFERLDFYVTIETGNRRLVSTEGTMDTLIIWTALLIYGPTALWVGIPLNLFPQLREYQLTHSAVERWNALRNIFMNLAVNTTIYLLGLTVYEMLGGQYPIQDLSVNTLAIALAAIGVFLFSATIIWMAYLGVLWINQNILGISTVDVARVMILALLLPNLINPFAIITAGLYQLNGVLVFLFMVFGLLMVAYLAHRFSDEAEGNRQRTRQLEILESLGESIIKAPPDENYLAGILRDNAPQMFPGRLLIWVWGEDELLRHPAEWDMDFTLIHAWLQGIESGQVFPIGKTLPWTAGETVERPTVVYPIRYGDSEEVIGGIYVELRRVAANRTAKALESELPALHALASQIASALQSIERYNLTLEYQAMSQELALAGRIQSSFLPNRMPDLPGWQLAVALLPARTTSGDFFDFIPLSNGRLGLVIADVADKGIGPALYMALSRTLLRTYAMQFENDPEAVLRATNQRMINDARANLFVTLFYAILDPDQGTLIYCNAGHNPPYLFRNGGHDEPVILDKTGIPIGIDEQAEWRRQRLYISPGDALILYTDGVTEAQNSAGEFFDEEQLTETVFMSMGRTSYEMQSAILEALQGFVGDHVQTDDITLMVLTRDNAVNPGLESQSAAGGAAP